ncbi:hypothetical protein [Ancylobacter defluvii]|uniref:Uncharacterized protein n=1 Tax=Ancylobacter defluvii TaxID=1282440 RepID=A0A9W6JV07_9HYPH|nr:hypothetical protein [Ancylobacter defluvii]MBS7588501.1 hypothetical protein [Ancylobacter defluvii]GLK83782.1 hypothetical protein GCM10017653_18520 [Ancylobacter defluvii]
MDLIGFDPATDFTILPWLSERLAGTMQPDDVILGGSRDLPLGSQALKQAVHIADGVIVP